MALTPASGLSSTLKDLAKRFMSLFARNPGLVDNVATKTDVDTITSDLASNANARGLRASASKTAAASSLRPPWKVPSLSWLAPERLAPTSSLETAVSLPLPAASSP